MIEGSLDNWLDGRLILINKPIGWTSFDVVNKIRWKLKNHFKVKNIKVGHAGTLDPKADGLLIVCVGKATKKIGTFQDQKKTYQGNIKLGYTTDSYDSETPENSEKFPTHHINSQTIKNTALSFIGESLQVPPLFSALKKNGKKLYEYARKGEKIELVSRNITIYKFDILSIKMPYVEFRIICSKGTYIRSIAHDFGKKLDCGAYLKSLTREKIGEYSLKEVNNQFIEN